MLEHDAAPRALVVEDAPDMRLVATSLLESSGFEVAEAEDGERALALARELRPDVVVLDLSLPRLDGLEVCRRLRTFSDAYVVIVSGREDETDKIVGLTAGADDYVTKPYSPGELNARVQAMLRRPRGRFDAGGSRAVGDVAIDVAARTVAVCGSPVALTRTEFELLAALSERPGAALERETLLERVWGPSWFGDAHVVDVHVSNLRRKLEGAGATRQLQTIRGVGFRLVERG